MKVVIVGLGGMGFSLAQRLDEEGHQLIVVDTNKSAVDRARNHLDVLALQESGFHLKDIDETNISDADLLIAVTDSDEVNLLTCLLARRLGIERHIARIEKPKLVDELGHLDGITIINPEQETVDRLANMVTSAGTTDSFDFAGGHVLLRALLADKGGRVAGKPLSRLRAEFSSPFVVTTIKRGTEFFVANGDTVIEEGDTVYVVLERGALSSFVEHFGFSHEARRVVVFGAGSIGRGLCAALEGSVRDLILIEPDTQMAEDAARELSSTSIIQGSPFERELLEELKVASADYFISLSGNDEGNLAAAIMAKRFGARTTVTLTGQPEYVEIFEPLPYLDAVVSPILLSVGAIVRRVRTGKVHSLTMIAGQRGEAIELEVLAGAPVAGKALKDIPFPGGMVLAAVQQGERVIIPTGETVLEAGQHVVAVVLKDTVSDAMTLFGSND